MPHTFSSATLNEMKNLITFTLCYQILHCVQDDKIIGMKHFLPFACIISYIIFQVMTGLIGLPPVLYSPAFRYLLRSLFPPYA